MKIGQLNGKEIGLSPRMETYRVGGAIPLPPSAQTESTFVWEWKNTLSTGIELHFDFGQEVFLADISVKLGESSTLSAAEVLVKDGASTPLCVGAYHAESGKTFGGAFDIILSHKARIWILRLTPTMTDLEVSIPDFYGAIPEENTLFPVPCSIEWTGGSIKAATLCAIDTDGHADSLLARSYLGESVSERWGLALEKGDFLVISHDDALPTDGYHLEVCADGAALAASTRLGLLYGIERLFEIAKNGSIPCCIIDDAPYKEMRGVHMYLPHKTQLGFAKSLWKSVLIPFHYNMIFLEIAGGMRYESHPEISESWLRGNRLAKEGKIPPFPHGSVAGGELLEKDEVRDLCDFARELGFELIPEVQSFGHVQYITYAHPEIAEIDPDAEKDNTDARDADIPPSLFYHHSYCPQNPKSYEIVYDLIDEIVEVVRPRRFVHMGHDEIYQLGLCPKCKNVPKDVLYEKHVTAMHDYLAKKGLRMMIWSDALQPMSKYQCYPALARLPKDILFLDFIWYFHFDKDIENNLLTEGHDLMIGNLYSSHFTRYESRIVKDHVLGGEVSFWVSVNEKRISLEGKFYDLMYTGNMLWSKEYREQAREVYAVLIAERLPSVRDRLHGCSNIKRSYQPVALPLRNERLPLAIKAACADMGLSAISLKQEVVVPVDARTCALRFTHTALYREKRIAWAPLVQVGTYCVRYEDDSEERIAVEYDGNVRQWKYRFGEPLSEKYYRHEGYVAAWEADPIAAGYTDGGEAITLMAYEWRNPCPEKKIVSVSCLESADTAAGLLLCGIDRVDYN